MTMSVRWNHAPRVDAANANSPARKIVCRLLKGASAAILLAAMLVSIVGVRIYAFVPALH